MPFDEGLTPAIYSRMFFFRQSDNYLISVRLHDLTSEEHRGQERDAMFVYVFILIEWHQGYVYFLLVDPGLVGPGFGPTVFYW